MSPDAEIAVGTAMAVILIFLIALWAQRRLERPLAAPDVRLGSQGKAWNDVFDGRLKTIEEWQQKTDHDVKNIRAALPALPTKDAVHRLEVQITELHGQIATVDATAGSTARAVDRIESYLLSGAREK